MLDSVFVVIQARMNSQRFPGKSLEPIMGKPALEHLIDSLLNLIDKAQLCVATSSGEADDPIATFVSQFSIYCHRGDESNVASRFFELSKVRNEIYFARISGDSPLFDYRILHQACELAEQSLATYIGTTLQNPYPSGMHVELFKRDYFQECYPSFTTDNEFEHVTTFIRKRLDEIVSVAVECPIKNINRFKFSFDNSDDLTQLKKVFGILTRPHFEYSFEEKCEAFIKAVETND
jgi:spore coat polysaccharide biosynthesis protein SpsF (cytidylyltransferase family)